MSTPIKILLAALAAIALIFIAIALAVAFVFEPNDYRPLVVDSVRDATGRDFELDGDLSLKLFPCCGVSVGSARLGNPPGFPDESFAAIESASVSVKIWPLLTRREVQIGTVALDGAAVNLIELADGRTNWTFDSGEPAEQPGEDTGAAISSLTIEGLELSDGAVTYTGADGKRYAAREILLDTGAIGGDAPVPLALKLTARDETTETDAEIELTGSLALADSLEGSTVTLNGPQLTVRATGASIPSGTAEVALTAAALSYDTDTATGSLKGLDASVTLPGTRLQLTGDAAITADAVTGSGSFRIPESNPRELMDALPDMDYEPSGRDALKRLTGSGRWSLTPTGGALSALDLTLDGSTIAGEAKVDSFDSGAATARIRIDSLALDGYLPEDSGTSAASTSPEPTPEATEVPFESLKDLLLDVELTIGRLAAQGTTLENMTARFRNDGRALSLSLESNLYGGHLSLNGSGNPAASSPMLTGSLEMKSLSPRAALTALGETVDTANPDVLADLSGSTRWQLGRRTLRLEQMNWKLDNTRLTGTLYVDGFDTPATRFDLALDRINLDDYLAPETDAEADDTPTEVEIPVEMLRSLDLNGRLKAGALRVMHLDLADVDATVTAENGVLRLEPLTAGLYGGTYQGNVVIDATGEKSRMTLDQRLSAVQVGQLLDTLVGSDRIAGALTLNLSGSGMGNTSTELLKALTGNIDFNLSDGVYHGMDIAYEIENAQSLLKRTAAPDRPNRKETPIRALSFAGSIVEGVLGSDSLNAEIPYLKLGGKGGVNLLERTIDYQLNAQVLKTADTATGTTLKGLGGSTIPLTISGPMADPKVRVNMQGLIVETVRETARDALLKRLGLDHEPEATGELATDASPEQAVPTETPAEPDTAEEAKPPSARELLEEGLRGLLKRPETEDR